MCFHLVYTVIKRTVCHCHYRWPPVRCRMWSYLLDLNWRGQSTLSINAEQFPDWLSKQISTTTMLDIHRMLYVMLSEGKPYPRQFKYPRDIPQAPQGRWHGLGGNWEIGKGDMGSSCLDLVLRNLTCRWNHFDKSCCVHDLSLSHKSLLKLWIETTCPCHWAKCFSWQRLNENKQQSNKYTILTWPGSHLLKSKRFLLHILFKKWHSQPALSPYNTRSLNHILFMFILTTIPLMINITAPPSPRPSSFSPACLLCPEPHHSQTLLLMLLLHS